MEDFKASFQFSSLLEKHLEDFRASEEFKDELVKAATPVYDQATEDLKAKIRSKYSHLNLDFLDDPSNDETRVEEVPGPEEEAKGTSGPPPINS